MLPLFLAGNASLLFWLQKQRENGRIRPLVRPDRSKEGLISKCGLASAMIRAHVLQP